MSNGGILKSGWVVVKKGKKIKISIKNASPKKTKWTVSKKGKSIVSLVSKKKKTVTIQGKKAGTPRDVSVCT